MEHLCLSLHLCLLSADGFRMPCLRQAFHVVRRPSNPMQLFCRKCAIPVSGILQELPQSITLNETDGNDFISKGYYLVSDGEYFTGSEGKLIINKSDLINCKDHPDAGRLNGCCGLDGLDGVNKVCANGHEIGTEKSDCWMAHAFIFEKGRVNSQSKRLKTNTF